MCSHHSGCDEEPLLSSSELFPQWWLCSRGFLALFFLLECSWTISMALLEWDWDTSFAHSRICSCVSNTWPKVPPSRRNSEHWFGFQATSPGRADAHKTMYYPASTGSPFCPHRNIFCTQKTRNFLKLLPTGNQHVLENPDQGSQSGHSRSVVWRTQGMSPHTTQGQGCSWGHQGSRWHVEMWVMDWEQIPRDNFKNGAIPHRFQNRFKSQSEWNQDGWRNLAKTDKNKQTNPLKQNHGLPCPRDWSWFFLAGKW